MKKILLILSIALMVICNWNFTRATDCQTPFLTVVRSYPYPDNNSNGCKVTATFCYQCGNPTENTTPTVYVQSISYSPNCGTLDFSVVENFVLNKIVDEANTLCTLQPCGGDNTYFDLYIPLCVTLGCKYNKDGSDAIGYYYTTCDSNNGSYCHIRTKICWDGQEEYYGQTFEVVGTPLCNVGTWNDFYYDYDIVVSTYIAWYLECTKHPDKCVDLDFKLPSCTYMPCSGFTRE